MLAAVTVTAIAVLALLVGEARGPKWVAWIAKPCASLGFVAAAWACGPDDCAGWTLMIGLLLCLVGDLCLLSRARAWFLAGLGAFFAGHVAYAAAFAQRGLATLPTIATAVMLIIPAIVVWRWLRDHVERPMRPPVLAYVVAITTMVACAFGTSSSSGDWLTIVGAVAFYLSDLAVARDVFVERAFVNRLWGLPLYYAAQLCLAATV